MLRLLTFVEPLQDRERKGSYFFTEVRAGLATFFAMAYIIAVNASIVADSGGTCVCESTADDPICLTNEAYALCTAEIKRDLVTATVSDAPPPVSRSILHRRCRPEPG